MSCMIFTLYNRGERIQSASFIFHRGEMFVYEQSLIAHLMRVYGAALTCLKHNPCTRSFHFIPLAQLANQAKSQFVGSECNMHI